MHTGHLILVKAESHQDAIDRVWTTLNYSDSEHFAANWSDWAVVGNEGFADSRWSFPTEITGWTGANEYAVSLRDEPELFNQAFERFYSYRQQAFESFKAKVAELDSSTFELDQDDLESWNLVRFAQLVDGIYNPQSHLYDLENYTANPKYFNESVESGEDDWFGVIVDFHY